MCDAAEAIRRQRSSISMQAMFNSWGPSINDVTLFWPIFDPPRHMASQKVRPLKYDITHLPIPPQKNKQMSSFKRNMFRINSIVVRVEGENNYMSKNLKCPGYFICIILEVSNEVT